MNIRKSVLVTGGSDRIGKLMAEGLASSGYAVVVHYNSSADKADAVVAKINQNGGTAFALKADLTNEKSATGLINRAVEKIGPLGLLINNASVFERDTLKKIDPALWDVHFAIHVKAPALLTSTFANLLPDGEEGLVVNMIDQRVLKVSPALYSYTLSKQALWAATRMAAQELAPHIRVNAIGPGPALINERQRPEDFDRQIKAVPLKRGPEKDEFTRTLLYLAENRSITGQMIALDGGQHLAWETPDLKVPE